VLCKFRFSLATFFLCDILNNFHFKVSFHFSLFCFIIVFFNHFFVLNIKILVGNNFFGSCCYYCIITYCFRLCYWTMAYSIFSFPKSNLDKKKFLPFHFALHQNIDATQDYVIFIINCMFLFQLVDHIFNSHVQVLFLDMNFFSMGPSIFLKNV
jgi:hypothetical protein